MNKEWRAELRGLLKQKRSITKDSKRSIREVVVRMDKVRRECERDVRRIEKQASRASARVDQRIAVLEGRLAQ